MRQKVEDKKKHRSRLWKMYFSGGVTYYKEMMELSNKEEREKLIADTFLAFYRNKYKRQLPKTLLERDCPHDFTFSDKNGCVYIEIASVRDTDESIKIQEIQSIINKELSKNKASFIIYTNSDINNKDVKRIINESKSIKSQLSVEFSLEEMEEMFNPIINLLAKNKETKIVKVSNLGNKRFFISRTNTENNFHELVIDAIKLKEDKKYKNTSEMILLIDDRSRKYNRQHIFSFLDPIIEYADGSPFKEIHLLSFRYVNEGGGVFFTLYPIKSKIDRTLRIRKFMLGIMNKWYGKPILLILKIYASISKDWHKAKFHP